MTLPHTPGPTLAPCFYPKPLHPLLASMLTLGPHPWFPTPSMVPLLLPASTPIPCTHSWPPCLPLVPALGPPLHLWSHSFPLLLPQAPAYTCWSNVYTWSPPLPSAHTFSHDPKGVWEWMSVSVWGQG